MGVELLKRFPPPASKTAQPNYPADALFNLKLGIAMAEFLSNRAGSKITAHDIRSGRAAKIIEKSSERRLAIAAEEGRHRREQEERQLAKRMKKAKKRIAKIERKIEELKRRNKDAFS